MKFQRCFITYFILVFSIHNAWAVAIDIGIKGNIIIPPCTINGGADINIDFGAIRVDDVDGNNYAKTEVVQFECENLGTKVYARIDGTQLVGAENNVLEANAGSSNSGKFGIAIYQGTSVNGSNALELGSGNDGNNLGNELTSVNVSGTDGSAIFTFVPYKQNELVASPFTASATINIYYP